jgi:glycosyltransferase involved in cell wall biosynthesis
MNKQTALVFYQYLPPWRIDVFNEMGKYYNLTIIFTNAECEGFTYDRKNLLSKLKNINVIFLNNGFTIGSRPIRFGLYKLITKYKPDIIFSHEYSPTSIILAFYKQIGFFKYKYYLTTSDNLKMAQGVKGIKATARSYVLNHADGIIVYSQNVKEWYTKHFPKLKIEICPNIQNPTSLLAYRKNFNKFIEIYKEKYCLGSSDIILYAGRLVEVKGLDLLLKAFSKINNPNYKLILVGEGNQKNMLQNLTKRLGIKDKVIFTGYYSETSLYAWYDIANFFILPSKYEPFGAVINESLIYGCPVVASKYIGALDFITPQNGIIFDPLNENDFISTLEEACNKYSKKNNDSRVNLMPCSFDEYVKAFININQ